MSNTVSFSGLGSGLDTSAIVSGLVAVARTPITRLQSRKSNLNAQQGVVSNLVTKLQALKTKAAALDSYGELLAHTATSSDTTSVGAAAGGDASAGSYNVSVTQLAAAQRNYSNAVSSDTQTGLLGTGTLTVTDGTGTPIVFTVDATTTLASLVSDINASAAAVDASVLHDGTSYRLLLNGTDTGAANAITYAESGVTLGLTSGSNQVQNAQDAIFDVDIVTGITRSSNVVGDVIPGVTLTLNATTASAVKVDVGPDLTSVQTNVQGFVDAYNDVAKVLAAQFGFDGTVDANKLQGDSTLRRLQKDLASALGSAVSGLSGTYTAAPQVGIKSERDGTLTLTAAELQTALQTDFKSVAQVFVTDSGASTTGVMGQLQTLVDNYTDFADGYLTTRSDGITRQLSSIDDDIARLQDHVDAYQAQLESQFNALETLMTGLQAQSAFMTNTFLK